MDLCEERLVEVESTVTALGSGRLSKFVISPAKLRETLSAVTEQLPTNYTLLFGADEALWPYYSVRYRGKNIYISTTGKMSFFWLLNIFFPLFKLVDSL